MSTRELVEAIIEGSSVEIFEQFEKTMSEKISVRLNETRIEYAQKMFRADAKYDFELAEMLADSLTEEQLEQIEEVLSNSASAGDWVSDFVKSDDPRFKGKSKEKRKQMALAAYYAKQRE